MYSAGYNASHERILDLATACAVGNGIKLRNTRIATISKSKFMHKLHFSGKSLTCDAGRCLGSRQKVRNPGKVLGLPYHREEALLKVCIHHCLDWTGIR